MKSLKRSLTDKQDDGSSHKYDLLSQDANQLKTEFQNLLNVKEEMKNANETTQQKLNEEASASLSGESDSEPLTPEVKEKLMQYLRTLKSQASTVLDEHRKYYKTISKALKDAEVTNLEDYEHMHAPFTACASALNVSEEDHLAMLDPLIADHFLKRSYTDALERLEEESRYAFPDLSYPHFEEIRNLHYFLREGDFNPIRRWLDDHEQAEERECNPSSPTVSHSFSDTVPLDTDGFMLDEATTDATEGTDQSPATKVVPQRYVGNHMLLSMDQKRQRLRFLLFKMEYIQALHAACSASAVGDNPKDDNVLSLVELARNLLKFSEDFDDEVQHLIGAMVLARDPQTFHKTLYSDLACPPSAQIVAPPKTETKESTPPGMELGDSASHEQDDMQHSRCLYRHSPSYEDAQVEASSLLSSLVCLLRDQPPHDSLDLLVHLGLSIMPQVYEKKDVVIFLAQKSNPDPQDYPVRVTNHEHAVHNVFHCPLKKDLFNAETDCVALTCGHVVSRAGFTGLKTNTRYARTLDGDRVICPYCPTHSQVSRVRGVIF